MNRRLIVLVTMLWTLLFFGCVRYAARPSRFITQPLISLSENIEAGLPLWYPQIKARYPGEKVVIVQVHGGEVHGEWYAFPDDRPPLPVKVLLRGVRTVYPHLRIVALVCNPAGIVLKMPGVTYAKATVWVIPDSYTDPMTNFLRDVPRNNIGSIREFVETIWDDTATHPAPNGENGSSPGTWPSESMRRGAIGGPRAITTLRNGRLRIYLPGKSSWRAGMARTN